MFDIAVVGHGLLGKTLVHLLNVMMPELQVAVIDRHTVESVPVDSRATALSPSSQEVLQRIGIWDRLASQVALMHKIRIGVNPRSKIPFEFSSKDSPLGWNVMNTDVHLALSESSLQSTTYYLGEAVSNIDAGNTCVNILFEGGEQLQARLLIGADGSSSIVRKLLSQTQTIDYHQTATSVTVSHSKPHDNVAYEFFIPQGVLAFIPLKDQHESTLVFSFKDPLFTEDHELLHKLISPLVQDHLGDISLPEKLPGYSLSARIAKPRYGHRWVLVGDAANTIHPAAGQSLNLGIRDADELVSHLSQLLSLGLDIGSRSQLEQYARSRQKDRYALFGVTHASAKYFTTSSSFLRRCLSGGLKGLDRIPVLSDLLSRAAKYGI